MKPSLPPPPHPTLDILRLSNDAAYVDEDVGEPFRPRRFEAGDVAMGALLIGVVLLMVAFAFFAAR